MNTKTNKRNLVSAVKSIKETPVTQYGQAAKVGGKAITAKTAKLNAGTFTPAPKSTSGKQLVSKDALSVAAEKKVFKSKALVANATHPSKVRAERKAAAKLLKEQKAEERKAAKLAKAEEKKAAKALRDANKPAKQAKAHEFKNEFVMNGKKLVFDAVIENDAKGFDAMRIAVEHCLVNKGWDFEVEVVKYDNGPTLVLTPKMEQGNISRQRCVMSGFVLGYLSGLAG